FSPCCFCDLPSNTPPTQIYTLSLHDALPIFLGSALGALFTLALSRLGSLVRLGVLLLELLQSGLLGLGARTRLLLALLLGFLGRDRKSTRLNSSHVKISYAVFCLKKKKKKHK